MVWFQRMEEMATTTQDTKEAGVLRAELLSTLPSIAHFLGRLKLTGARLAVPMQAMADLVPCSSTTQVQSCYSTGLTL